MTEVLQPIMVQSGGTVDAKRFVKLAEPTMLFKYARGKIA